MIHTINIAARYFPVEVEHIETGARLLDSIVLDKQQLQAAQAVGQSSKELIHRLYQRQGFKVLVLGKQRNGRCALIWGRCGRLSDGKRKTGGHDVLGDL